ncbi:MAG: TusE/DsrC/DsvC family sulfur relay protein [Gemmatimonadetes bacterium]|nr:TusE/DsrC/DsvC family sulfur relay protein [Gemmatimonadota bacterium]
MSTVMIASVPIEVDAEGFMTDPDQWTPGIAIQLGREAGIEPLTDRHWQVIDFCRSDNAARGTPPTVRRITKATGIPTKEMYQLFPKGPGILASRIAGLTKPKGCI